LPSAPGDRSASLELWFRPSDLVDKEVLFETGGSQLGSSFLLDGPTLLFATSSNSTAMTLQMAAPVPATGDFIHAVATLSLTGGAADITLYVNGQAVDSRTVAGYTGWTGSNAAGLATSNSDLGGDFNYGVLSGFGNFSGEIALLRLYDTALSSTQVAQTYAAAQASGADYIEGGGGEDTIVGGPGQDDLIGGSSSLFGLAARDDRPDGADRIYGGEETLAARNDVGDLSDVGHAADADVIAGDNANIYRLVDGTTGAWLTFNHDTSSGDVRVLPRAVEVLDPVKGNDIQTLDLDDWTLNGTASQITVGELRLTSGATNEAGSAFTSQPLAFGADYSFNARFQVDIHDAGGLTDGDGPGADGLAFVLQNAAASELGDHGGSFGLPSNDVAFLAIELDSFSGGRFDPSILPDHFSDSGHLFTDSQDIGSPGLAGSASEAGGVYTVAGSGTDIWNTSDSFRFVSGNATGDAEIIVRVGTFSGPAEWSKAGVMFRDGTGASAAHVALVQRPDRQLSLQWRDGNGLAAGWEGLTFGGSDGPKWLRLTRQGDLFIASYSLDGENWIEGGRHATVMGDTVRVGLAVTATDNSGLATATFDNVAIAGLDDLPSHLGVDTNVDGSLARVAIERFNDGVQGENPRWVWADYDGNTQRLDVYLSSTADKPARVTLSTAVDLQALFGTGTPLYVGFSAATGGGFEVHDVLDFALRRQSGYGGDDLLIGGSGDDVILGQTGNDVLFGEGQDDDLIGGDDSDRIFGGAGEDGILGDNGLILTSRNGLTEPLNGVEQSQADLVFATDDGTTGSVEYLDGYLRKGFVDLDSGGGAADLIYGGLGDDFIFAGGGDDAASGAEALAANYVTKALTDPDVLGYDGTSGLFADYDPAAPLTRIDGFILAFEATDAEGNVIEDGKDRIFGGADNDWLVGGTGKDRLFGGTGDDVLDADDNPDTDGGLNDTLEDAGLAVADFAFGGAGRDTLIANTGADRLIDWGVDHNRFIAPFALSEPTQQSGYGDDLAAFLIDLAAASGADATPMATVNAIGLVRPGDPGWDDEQTAIADQPPVGALASDTDGGPEEDRGLTQTDAGGTPGSVNGTNAPTTAMMIAAPAPYPGAPAPFPTEAAPIREGEEAVLGIRLSGPGALLGFTIDEIDWGDGSPIEGDISFDAGTDTVILRHIHFDDPTGGDTFTITIRGHSRVGEEFTFTYEITVRNRAPEIDSLTTDALAVGAVGAGETVTLSGSFHDAGAIDTHLGVIDWGDGTVESQRLPPTNVGQGGFAFTHIYATGGVFAIGVDIIDDDGGLAHGMTSALVTGARLHDGVLEIVGTGGSDDLRIKRAGGDIVVDAKGRNDHAARFDLDLVRSISILLGDGNDKAEIDGRVLVPLTIDGGAGDDWLIAGGGAATLIGGAGRDALLGGSGDDDL
ncbi:MAG: hypothetical protein KDI64_15410, partial [Candidatus Accumulibacter sp.]|nr:hypothetical protein [Accumulibacter sp.]